MLEEQVMLDLDDFDSSAAIDTNICLEEGLMDDMPIKGFCSAGKRGGEWGQ